MFRSIHIESQMTMAELNIMFIEDILSWHRMVWYGWTGDDPWLCIMDMVFTHHDRVGLKSLFRLTVVLPEQGIIPKSTKKVLINVVGAG